MIRYMVIWVRVGVFWILTLTGTPLAVTASPAVLDQSFISGDGTSLGANINEGFEFIAQTFTAGVSGELEGIEIDVNTVEHATSRLNIAIRTAVNQIPTETVLGSVLVDRGDTGLGNLVRFSQTIEIVDGKEYAIVVNYPDVPHGAGQFQGLWYGEVGDQYAGGMFSASNDGITWQIGSSPSSDLYFQTYVKKAPLEVSIDVKPGSDDNCFKINGHGVIPVAILGAEDFHVEDIDLDTLSFQGLSVRVRGEKGPLCSSEYSNNDEYLDTVCRAVQFSEYALIPEDSVEVESIFIKGGSDIGDVVPAKNIQCKAA